MKKNGAKRLSSKSNSSQANQAKPTATTKPPKASRTALPSIIALDLIEPFGAARADEP
jgi:hypothetical protein